MFKDKICWDAIRIESVYPCVIVQPHSDVMRTHSQMFRLSRDWNNCGSRGLLATSPLSDIHDGDLSQGGAVGEKRAAGCKENREAGDEDENRAF